MKQLSLIVLFSLLFACAKAPPNLTPEANAAFKGTQAVKALDLLRDTAISANAQVPPVLSEAITRKVVLYHQSTVKVIQAAPTGWKATVGTGLDELLSNLTPSERAVLAPYVTLIKTVITEVTR